MLYLDQRQSRPRTGSAQVFCPYEAAGARLLRTGGAYVTEGSVYVEGEKETPAEQVLTDTAVENDSFELDIEKAFDDEETDNSD